MFCELLTKVFISSDSVEKMGDELANLMDIFNSFKKAGRSATLTLSTKGSKATKVKLEVELEDAKPSSPSTTTATAPSTSLPCSPGCQAVGVRLRPRRLTAKRAKANARAAQHRAFLALPFPGGDYSAALGPPDPSPPQPHPQPLHIHPSPHQDSGRRQVITVGREVGVPTFSQLDGDPPSPTSPSPATPSASPDSSPPSPLPPPCFPDPFPRCCHCKGECPCSWGGWCRRCPRRRGTGRPHDCQWCPGSWCKNPPLTEEAKAELIEKAKYYPRFNHF